MLFGHLVILYCEKTCLTGWPDYAGHVKGEKNVRHFKVPMTRNFVAFSD